MTSNITNKSEELATLLGIEPKYKLRYGMLEDDFWILDREQCENHIKNTKNIYYTPHIENDEIYPDFKKPSNFVKLLEFIHKNIQDFNICRGLNRELAVEFDCNCYASGIDLKETFIQAVISFGFKNYELSKVQQQAQQIEWEW